MQTLSAIVSLDSSQFMSALLISATLTADRSRYFSTFASKAAFSSL